MLGGSWGSTLALAYAQTHPARVSELVLAPVPTAERGDVMRAYQRLLNDPDPAVHRPAAVAWSVWEAATVTLIEDPALLAAYEDPAFSLAFARIENHYFCNNGWLQEGQLIASAAVLQKIPGIIVQGRYDMCTPPVTAWDLHQARPSAQLLMVPATGHAGTEPGNTRCLILATDEFADRSLDPG